MSVMLPNPTKQNSVATINGYGIKNPKILNAFYQKSEGFAQKPKPEFTKPLD